MEYIVLLLLGFVGLLIVIGTYSLEDELDFILFMQLIWTSSLYAIVWAAKHLLN